MKNIEISIDNKKNVIFFVLSIFPFLTFFGSGVINFYLIIVFIYFIYLLIKKKIIFKNLFFIKILIIFWITVLINLVFSDNFNQSFSRCIGLVRFIPFALLIAFLFAHFEYYKNKVLKIWLITFIVVSADLILEKITGQNSLGFSSNANARLSGFLNDELKIGNYYYYFYLISLITIYNFYTKKFRNILSLGLLFLAISFFIGERANFLKCLFLFISFFLIVYSQKTKKLFLVIIIFFSIVLVYTNSNQLYKTRFLDKLFLEVYNKGIVNYYKDTHHAAHAYTAIEIFKKNKFFGIGLNNFRNESQKSEYENLPIKKIKGRWSTHPHQYHFEFLSETGLFGYLSWIIFMIINIYFSIKSFLINKKNYFLLINLLIFITNLFPFIPTGSFFTTYGATLFWMNYGLLISQNEKFKKKIKFS